MISLPFFCLVTLVVSVFVALRIRQRGATKSGKTTARLSRVKNAGLIFMVLLAVCLPMSVYEFLGFLFGWNRPLSQDVCRAVVLQQVYDTPAAMPAAVFWLWVVKHALNWFAGLMMLRLFWFYSRGIIFSDKNTTCIRVQGYCLIIGCLIDLVMQHGVRASSVSLNPIIYGLLIIFVAWIMDEGRKIQEEHELTV